MSKYKFIKYQDPQNPYDTTKVVLSSDTVCIDTLLGDIEDFLRACGFTVKGDLVILPYEELENE